jgi:maltooligosyltrehalose synthase
MNLDHHDGLSDPIEYVQNTRFILSMCLHYQFPPIWYL